jgi:hypothetical protein
MHEHHVDISCLYARENICIEDYVSSLQRDARLVRESKGTPKNANVFGYSYDIDTEKLTLVVEDRAGSGRSFSAGAPHEPARESSLTTKE